jgi:hypothetical protein
VNNLATNTTAGKGGTTGGIYLDSVSHRHYARRNDIPAEYKECVGRA